MSSNFYLYIDCITGECQDADHKGWFDVNSFTWGAIQPGNMNIGSGSGIGKVQYRDLTVLSTVDKGTSTILKYTSNGKHIKKVEISACKAGDKPLEYCRITLEDVIITGVTYTGANEKGGIGIAYQFQASRVKHCYWEQLATGSKGAAFESGWDIKAHCAI